VSRQRRVRRERVRPRGNEHATGPTCGPKAVSMTVSEVRMAERPQHPLFGRLPDGNVGFPLPPRRDAVEHYRCRERPGSIARRGPAPTSRPQRPRAGARSTAPRSMTERRFRKTPRRGAQSTQRRSVLSVRAVSSRGHMPTGKDDSNRARRSRSAHPCGVDQPVVDARAGPSKAATRSPTGVARRQERAE
jgi:hypothetical protein